jgi:hypothetical protein
MAFARSERRKVLSKHFQQAWKVPLGVLRHGVCRVVMPLHGRAHLEPSGFDTEIEPTGTREQGDCKTHGH